MRQWLRLSARALHARLLWAWARFRCGEEMPLTDLPILVFAPHPDDETIGCGGLIALKRQRNVAVHVVFVTDGGNCFGGEGPTKAEVATVRHAEALAALKALDVPEENAYFLNLPDGGLGMLSEEKRRIVTARIEKILHETRPGEVLVTFRQDTHKDHEASFRLVQTALENVALDYVPVLIEYVIWRFWGAPLLRSAAWKTATGARLLRIGTVVATKRAAIRAYPSQFPVLPGGFLREHSRDSELYYMSISPKN